MCSKCCKTNHSYLLTYWLTPSVYSLTVWKQDGDGGREAVVRLAVGLSLWLSATTWRRQGTVPAVSRRQATDREGTRWRRHCRVEILSVGGSTPERKTRLRYSGETFSNEVVDLSYVMWLNGASYQKTVWEANRIWPMGNRMFTWPMTSLDPETSRSWPQHIVNVCCTSVENESRLSLTR